MINSIAIFCGSSMGNDPIYAEHAAAVGTAIAQAGKTLVYGGGHAGLMGVVADHALKAGGKVIGVMPKLLVDEELAHPNLTELHIVENMSERKQRMSELSDAFIALPGGAGTLEEIFEQWTWLQLDIHKKACAFLNVSDFYTDLICFLERTVNSGFTQPRFVKKLVVAEQIDDILQQFENYIPPEPKWTLFESVDGK
jgi:uncharacterized protein (TIGR00730 family)